MIAYDKIKLDNLLVRDFSKRLKRLNLIDETILTAIAKAKQPAYNHTNIFIRIGVLLLTFVLTFCSYGLLVLFFGLDAFSAFKVAVIIFAITTFAALEFFIKTKNNYATGIDDALLYFALMCYSIFLGLTIAPENSAAFLLFFALLFPIIILAFMRYTDKLVAVIGYITLLLLCFYATMQLGDISKLIMPFVIMLIAITTYFFISKLKVKYTMRFYHDGLHWLQYAALLSFYAAGNYYIVREASVQFFDMQLKPGEEIPLYWLFYAFTVLVPIAYVYFGLNKKDNVRLNCGLILIAVSIATIRYYHEMITLEIALLLGGILLLAIAYMAYHYLKTPKHGFTFEEDKGNAGWFSKDVEAIIIAQAMAAQTTAPKHDAADFGEGKFGGGGAGESF